MKVLSDCIDDRPPTGSAEGDAAALFSRVAVRTRAWSFSHWYWGDAIAVDGMLAANGAADGDAREHTVRQLRRWAQCVPENDDDVLAPGRALADLAAAGELDNSPAERFIAAVGRLPITADGIPLLEPHRAPFRFGVCIDAVYHLPAALAAYGRLTDDDRRVDEATRMAVHIMRHLRCAGGWAHWYDAARGENNAVPWSRGAGWALLGLLDLLAVSGHTPFTDEVTESAVAILDRLADTQAADGTWPAVLGDRAARSETSTAAFFVAGALHPSTRGIWKAPRDTLDRAGQAIVRAVDAAGVVRGVSADVLPGWDAAGYRSFPCEPSPWGQGAALRAMAALRDA